jgi:hypothetical protein
MAQLSAAGLPDFTDMADVVLQSHYPAAGIGSAPPTGRKVPCAASAGASRTFDIDKGRG